MSGDRTRLPKWAQREMEQLERNVDYWKAKVLDDTVQTDTVVDHYPDGRTPLPNGARVTFGAEYNEHRGIVFVRGIEAYWADGRLVVRGTDGIAVRPHATNSIEIVRVER